MTWGEKIQRILGQRPLAEIERSVGLVANTLSNRMRAGSRINVEDGLKIARYLGVDPYWLFDDANDWPPPALVPQGERDLRATVLRIVGDALSSAADAIGEDSTAQSSAQHEELVRETAQHVRSRVQQQESRQGGKSAKRGA